MADNEKIKRTLWEQAVENALRFAFNLAFVFIYQSIFGVHNVLPGVAIGVGMTMFPDGYIGVRPMTMVLRLCHCRADRPDAAGGSPCD